MKQRELALNILNKTIADESYSNLLMRRELNRIEPIKRAFVTNLVNGVLRKYEFLSFQFAEDIEPKTSLRIRLILCMAMFERFVLKQEDYVVNNEYVSLGQNKYEKAFINVLLHKHKSLKLSPDPDVNACLPKWIYNLLAKQYSKEDLNRIVSIYQRIPDTYYRINKRKCVYEDLKHLDIEIINEDSFRSRNNLLKTREYQEGFFYVQDVNSASLYRHLDLKASDKLLDVCCAPGSKLFNCLDILKPQNCYGNDLHSHRVELIKQMAEKLGYNRVNYLNLDGRDIKDNVNLRFDKILLDAPCSGLGVIGRKPDLKFHIKPADLDELQILQYQLLNSMDEILMNGGILLYSTCTLNKKENEKLIRKFLSENDHYLLVEDETIINELGDCFYYAKMKKVG